MPPLQTASIISCNSIGLTTKVTMTKETDTPRVGQNQKQLLTSPGKMKRGLFKRLSSRNNSTTSEPLIEERRPSQKSRPLAMDDELQLMEDDPVVALLEARNTQRVRFCLEGKQPTRDPVVKVEPITEKPDPSFNIKTFMSKALFRKGSVDMIQGDTSKPEKNKKGNSADLAWESADVEHGSELLYSSNKVNAKGSGALMLSYTEDSEIRQNVLNCLNKSRRAQFSHYRYEYAVKMNVKALNQLSAAKYPSDHPLMLRTRKSLNNAHHMLHSYKNSANIVKMGIKYEEAGELVRALKMYTIAYRMRRDQLSKTHPSLVVLLNILGSIQIKRMELQEAMQIFELALKQAPSSQSSDDASHEDESPPPHNLLARAVTFRDMGTIHEKLGAIDKALVMYHRSLDCASEWKDATFSKSSPRGMSEAGKAEEALVDSICSLEKLQLSKTFRCQSQSEEGVEISVNGDIEHFVGSLADNVPGLGDKGVSAHYNSYFPEATNQKERSKKKGSPTREDYADVDIAMTLHQIAQMHRGQCHYGQALDAYNAALRGMKHALGDVHPNVAAILGNIGNLQKEHGDLDAAYETYQEVLRIESNRLGVSHPEVAISLHNVATIEAARGNYAHSLGIYMNVHYLQKKLFGEENAALGVTSACMGDVHERLGNLKAATDCYEDALKIKSATIGRHNLEVARVLHKLGKLSFQRKDLTLADSYISRAVLLYRLNRLGDEHEWVYDAHRDAADIDAAMAMGGGFLLED